MTRIRNKIINLGFSKTGTTSIHRFLSDCGLKSAHDCKELFKLRGNTDEFINSPIWDDYEAYSGYFPMNWKAVVENSEDCKFILTLRDIDTWQVSAKRHFKRPSAFSRELFRGYTFLEYYKKYNSDVITYFVDNSLPLCTIDLEQDHDPSKVLKRFLGIENDIQIPWENKTRL